MAKGLLQPVTWRSGTLVLLESSLIVTAVIASMYVVLGPDAWGLVARGGVLPKALLIAYICQLCLYYTDLYDDPKVGGDGRELLVRLMHALGATALILSALYFWFPTLIIGTIEGIPAIVRARRVDRVVVDLAEARGKLPMDKLLDMRLAGVAFEHLTSVYEEYTGKIAVENLRPSWLVFSSGFRKTRWLTVTKRLIDV